MEIVYGWPRLKNQAVSKSISPRERVEMIEVRNQGREFRLPEWMKQVGPQDLPEVYQEMAEVIGVEATVLLARLFAGTSVYFPKLDRALLSLRNRAICREFNGDNIKLLARRWGLSARHLRHIVNPNEEPDPPDALKEA
jgi:hypothetical protein